MLQSGAMWGSLRFVGSTAGALEFLPHQRPGTNDPSQMSFLGTYDHTLDAKNRITVPVKFRGPLGEGAVVSRGIESCVSVWTPEGFSAWKLEMVEAFGGVTPQARAFKRVLAASAFETELDAAGRIMLPGKLIDHAGISREVSVIGNDEAFEIWDRAAWGAYDESVSPTILELTDAIGSND